MADNDPVRTFKDFINEVREAVEDAERSNREHERNKHSKRLRVKRRFPKDASTGGRAEVISIGGNSVLLSPKDPVPEVILSTPAMKFSKIAGACQMHNSRCPVHGKRDLEEDELSPPAKKKDCPVRKLFTKSIHVNKPKVPTLLKEIHRPVTIYSYADGSISTKIDFAPLIKLLVDDVVRLIHPSE